MSIVQGITSSIVYKILNVIAVFIINIWLSRLAGAEGLGILSFTIATLSVYNLITSFGLDASITYNTAAKKILPEKIITFIIVIVLLQIATAFIVDALAYFITGTQFFGYHQTNYFFVSMLLLVSISLTEKFSALLAGQNLFKPLNGVLFYSNLFSVIVLTVLWFFNFNLSAIEVLQIFIVLTFCQSLSLIILYYFHFPFKFSFAHIRSAELKILFSYAMITFISNLIQFMAYRIDYWLIAYYLKSETALGLYAQSVRLSQLFWILPLFFASIIFPLIARKKDFADTAKLLSIIRVMNVFNLVGCVIAFLLADWLMPFLFGKEFSGSSYPFKLLLPGIFLFTNTTIIAAYFAGINKLKINMLGSAICLVTVLVLDIILIPSYGIEGASIATSIAYSLTTLYFTLVFLRRTNSSITDLFFFTGKDINTVMSWLKLSSSKYPAL